MNWLEKAEEAMQAHRNAMQTKRDLHELRQAAITRVKAIADKYREKDNG